MLQASRTLYFPRVDRRTRLSVVNAAVAQRIITPDTYIFKRTERSCLATI